MSEGDLQIRNRVAILIQLGQGSNDVVHVLFAELGTVDGKTHHIADFFLLFGGFQIIFHREISQLGAADAVAVHHFQRECLTGKTLMVSLVIKEAIDINIDAVSARRLYHRNAVLREGVCKVLALSDALVLIIKTGFLIKALCKRHDVVTGHSAVGVIAVSGDLAHLQQMPDVHLDGTVFIEFGEFFPEKPLVTEGQ